MARPLTLRDLLDRLEPVVAEAFMQAVRDLQNDVAFAALEEAIARRDIDAALRALRLDRAEGYFEPLSEALRQALLTGGNHAFVEGAAQARRQGAQVAGRLDATNPRAERLLRSVSSQRIVEITDETRETVREILGEAMTVDASPRVVALNIVGRINSATKRREGGVLGLTSMEARWVANARAELESGDPGLMAAYFDRKARDRRFDRTVSKAIKEGRPVARADVERILTRYHDTLLRGRGERIGRTEVLGTLHRGHDEGLQQMVDRGDIRADAITYEWRAAFDRDTRDGHAALHGKQVKRGEPFRTIEGYLLRFPGDRELGAPAETIINCRCSIASQLSFITGLKDRLSPEELAEVRAAMVE